jgi:hypothetical protein
MAVASPFQLAELIHSSGSSETQGWRVILPLLKNNMVEIVKNAAKINHFIFP